MRLALAVVLTLLAAMPSAAGDRSLIGGILGGVGGFGEGMANALAEQRREDLERERLRLERQRLDQELAYQRALLEQNQRQFDAQMAAQREQRAQFDAAKMAAAEREKKARGPVPRNTAELEPPSRWSIVQNVVAACAEEVRAQTHGSRFDAYLTVEQGVSMWGTKEEQFKFEKCLHLRATALLESERKR